MMFADLSTPRTREPAAEGPSLSPPRRHADAEEGWAFPWHASNGGC